MFTSSLTGTTTAPIIVRQYPGERAIIDGPADAYGGSILVVNGAATWYWGFEVTCSTPNRYVSRATAISVYAPNTRFINLVIHDTGQGFGFWQPATDSTIYGSVIYNNGFEGGDRGHGHSIYTQNQTTTKHILDNIFFQSFSVGLHAYSQNGGLNNLDVEGNVAFNHGTVSLAGAKHNLLIGGGPIAQNPTVLNNYTYYPSSATSGRNELGYGSGCNNLQMTGNYFAQPTALILNCTNVTMTGNTLAGGITGFTQSQFPSNTYFPGRATGTAVFVRPNAYEPGRANIVVYNWSNASTASVDVSGVLKVGDAFEVRDAQNFLGAPVLTGTYAGGKIILPTVLSQISPTVGTFPVPPTHTSSEFNVYVLLPRSGSSTTQNGAPAVYAGANQTITLPGSASLDASVSDDGLPNNTLTMNWSKVSGPGTVTFSPTNAARSTASFSVAGTYVLQLAASDGVLTTTSQITVVVNAAAAPATPTGTAQFVQIDTATKGNWRGVYGADGGIVINDSSVIPAFAKLTPSGYNAYTWADAPLDFRALSRRTGTGRIAAAWYSPTSMTLDLNQTDGIAHKLAIYCVDWDGAREQRIDVIDAGTNTVLDSRTLSSFHDGQYVIWNVTGHVLVRITRTVGSNAVISGIFWGAGSTAPSATTAAQFLSVDTATQGDWKNIYGATGELVVADSAVFPASISVSGAGQYAYTWNASTSDRRALQQRTSSNRIASTWFSSDVFDVNIKITDGSTRRIALYCLDWDSGDVRAQKVQILNASSGAVLDTRTLSSFSGGSYLIWKVSGHVIARITRLQGSNAVLSGFFVD